MKMISAYDLYKELERLKKQGIDLKSVPVTIGNDEELNGSHRAYFMQIIDVNEDNKENEWIKFLCKFALRKYDEELNKFIEFDGKTFLIS